MLPFNVPSQASRFPISCSLSYYILYKKPRSSSLFLICSTSLNLFYANLSITVILNRILQAQSVIDIDLASNTEVSS